MGSARPSMQELIGRRKRAGFVGRRSELDLFRRNFDLPPEDERHTFIFHVHGTAGVGKSSLVRELEAVAVRREAFTACTDESVRSVPEVMAAISAQFARQGVELKALDRLLATYRQRRHEAETASAALETGPGSASPATPSAGGMAMAQAGLIGLGMVPGVGAFTGALDPAQVAYGTDRLRAALSARFRSHDDVRLVLEPLKVLTPVFVSELDRVAANTPWIALFFDTYERTAPYLDAWLLDLITTDRYGALPSNVVVTLAGQHGPDPARWADYAGFVTELALDLFTDAEARQLLAVKGVVDEDVVQEVLRLSGGLPVLVSTLAKNAPGEVGAVDDPSADAVERFLKWERDPALRATALACALPRWLDEDVFRAAADDEESEGSYEWLRGLPFVSEREGRVRYHDVVRMAMLRRRRARAPRQWAERHARLAEVFGTWRTEAEEGLEPDELWLHESWRELRLEEAYHQLCARPRTALGQVLPDMVRACDADEVAARGCAQVLADAGEQAGAEAVRDWGLDLLGALSSEPEPVPRALGLLLDRAGLDASARAEAHCVRGKELRRKGEYERSLAEYDQAATLDPASAEAYYGRGATRSRLGDREAALADLQHADELSPGKAWIVQNLGEELRLLGRQMEAVEAFDRALDIDPAHKWALASRGYSKQGLGDAEGALADFDRALEIDETYLWALVHRAEVYRRQGRPAESFADLDRAVAAAPDSSWVASERGDAYRLAGRHEEAVEELGRACAIDPAYASAHAGRGYALARLNRHEEARAAFDRAIELEPTYVWALVQRGELRGDLGDEEGQSADLDLAVAADTASGWALRRRGFARVVASRYEEALADADLALEREPDDPGTRLLRGFAVNGLGRPAEAVAEYDRILERDPGNWTALWQRAERRLESGQYRASLRDLDRALSDHPDEGDLYRCRANVCVATGRLDQARADLQQCLAHGYEAEWARGRMVDVLLRQERFDEAVSLLDGMRADAEREGDTDTMVKCWYADVVTGRWTRALETADWLRSNDLDGAVTWALTIGAREGLHTAEPLWRESPRPVEDGRVPDLRHVLTACALGDWTRADEFLSEILAEENDWEDLAELAAYLTLLAHTPGIDTTLLGPRTARITEARDAFQSRYAE